MQYPSQEIEQLYQEALIYDQRGDAYNSIKLFKRIIKLAPDWSPPYCKLGTIYKYRREWKAALHYNKKAVALEPTCRTCWWDKGIAATALKKPRIAKRVWAKFGLQPSYTSNQPLLSLRLEYDKKFEILWAKALGPALAIIASIPHPDSDRKYKDLVLYDGQVSGYNVVQSKRYEVFDELGIFKRSLYRTFSTTLVACSQDALQLLERLCLEAGLGFENWSNATKSYTTQIKREYYGPDLFLKSTKGENFQVAIASKHESTVLQVLQSWAVITLNQYTDLVEYS